MLQPENLTEEQFAKHLIEKFSVVGHAIMCAEELLHAFRYAADSKINYYKRVIEILEKSRP